MNISKIIVGWVLLAAGVVLIIWALVSSYNIFTGKDEVPDVFKIQNFSAAENSQITDVQAQMQELVQEQLKNLIPTEAISKILNLSVWSLLAFVFIFGGQKIADLGVKLLKKE